MSINGGGSGHCRANEMGAPATSLTALKVAVAGRGAALALREAITVHSDTHAASRLAPLKACLAEDVGQSLLLGHAPHLHRAGHNDGAHIGSDVLALHI